VASSANVSHFLRAARSRLQPRDVGLVPQERRSRRVKGLRRDEVARLAGVSVEYYTRIEQGRVARVSDVVIHGLADALRLTETERKYLVTLIGGGTGARAPKRPAAAKVRPSIRQLLERVDNSACFVLGTGMRALAMNSLAKALLHDFTQEAGLRRSLARWTFLDPVPRSLYLDFEVVAADVAAILRRDSAAYPNDAELNQLIGELTVKSDEFRAAWSQHKVYECSHGTKRLLHPVVGRIDIEYETFMVPNQPDQQLFIYGAKAGSPSEDALRILATWSADEAQKPVDGASARS